VGAVDIGRAGHVEHGVALEAADHGLAGIKSENAEPAGLHPHARQDHHDHPGDELLDHGRRGAGTSRRGRQLPLRAAFFRRVQGALAVKGLEPQDRLDLVAGQELFFDEQQAQQRRFVALDKQLPLLFQAQIELLLSDVALADGDGAEGLLGAAGPADDLHVQQAVDVRFGEVPGLDGDGAEPGGLAAHPHRGRLAAQDRLHLVQGHVPGEIAHHAQAAVFGRGPKAAVGQAVAKGFVDNGNGKVVLGLAHGADHGRAPVLARVRVAAIVAAASHLPLEQNHGRRGRALAGLFSALEAFGLLRRDLAAQLHQRAVAAPGLLLENPFDLPRGEQPLLRHDQTNARRLARGVEQALLFGQAFLELLGRHKAQLHGNGAEALLVGCVAVNALDAQQGLDLGFGEITFAHRHFAELRMRQRPALDGLLLLVEAVLDFLGAHPAREVGHAAQPAVLDGGAARPVRQGVAQRLAHAQHARGEAGAARWTLGLRVLRVQSGFLAAVAAGVRQLLLGLFAIRHARPS